MVIFKRWWISYTTTTHSFKQCEIIILFKKKKKLETNIHTHKREEKRKGRNNCVNIFVE